MTNCYFCQRQAIEGEYRCQCADDTVSLSLPASRNISVATEGGRHGLAYHVKIESAIWLRALYSSFSPQS
jgi:hypothetical protein